MRKNTALAKWRTGEQTIGGCLSLANTHTAEMMANAGFDWLCVDMQHGLLDYQLPGEGTGKHRLLAWPAHEHTAIKNTTLSFAAGQPNIDH